MDNTQGRKGPRVTPLVNSRFEGGLVAAYALGPGFGAETGHWSDERNAVTHGNSDRG